jgi:hypothetical protein
MAGDAGRIAHVLLAHRRLDAVGTDQRAGAVAVGADSPACRDADKEKVKLRR